MSKLSKSYESTLNFILFVDLPQDIALTTYVPGDIRSDIRAKGWDLLSLAFKGHRDTIYIKPENATQTVISESSLKRSIIDQMGISNLQILRVFPDNLNLEYQTKKQKKVKVVLENDIDIDPGYTLSQPIRFEPSEVLVTGPESALDRISEVKVVFPSEPSALDASTMLSGQLKTTAHPTLNFAQNTVNIHVELEQLTEKEWLIPITIRGETEIISLLPDKVLLKGLVGMSKYDKTTNSAFDFYVIPEEENSTNKLRVQYDAFPAHVKYISHSPKTVEYFIINN